MTNDIDEHYSRLIKDLADKGLVEDSSVDHAMELFEGAYENFQSQAATQIDYKKEIEFLAVAAFYLALQMNDEPIHIDLILRLNPKFHEEPIRLIMMQNVDFASWCHPTVHGDLAIHLHRFCTMLELSSRPRLVASYIVNKILMLNVVSWRANASIAAIGAIRTCELLSLHTRMTQRDFCSLFRVALTSFRKLNRLLVTHWRKIIPDHLWPTSSALAGEYPQPIRVLSQHGFAKALVPTIHQQKAFADDFPNVAR